MNKRYDTIITATHPHGTAANAPPAGRSATLVVSISTLVLGAVLAINLANSLVAPTLF